MPSIARVLVRHVAADVGRRQGLAIAAALGIGQWMIRSFPPWDLRDAAYLASPEARAPWLVGVVAAVIVVSRPLVRRLLGAREVRMLRHLPIAARTWRWIHGTQLLVLDLPIQLAVLYGLWPLAQRSRANALAWLLATIAGCLAARVGQCILLDRTLAMRGIAGALTAACALVLLVICDPFLAAVLALLAAIAAVRRLGRPFPEPRVRSSSWLPALRGPALARAWLQLGCLWHRDRAMVWIAIAVQTVLVVLGAVAAKNLHARFPADARWAVELAACVAAAMAMWCALRSERALADDRWVLDPLIGARTIDLGGRMIAAAVLASPALLATVIVVSTGLHELPVRALVAAASMVVWTAAAATELGCAAELHRSLRRPQVLAIAGRVALLVVAALLLGPLGALVLALASLLLAARRWPAADRTRRRFARLPGEIEASAP